MTDTARQVDNRLKQLTKHGQSIWLDFIRRSYLKKGELRKLVEQDGLRGVTSNPSIFEKAIGGSDDYKEQLSQLVSNRSLDANDLYERLAIQDIQEACDVMRIVFNETVGRDGYVSMEVSPLLARQTDETIQEAKRLWKEVDRPNLMVKVPGTEEGIPAIQQLIGDGMNINVTLLFSVDAYKKVAEAYMSGLEDLVKRNGDPAKVASVASFFVSRIDSLADKLLHEKIEATDDEKEKNRYRNLLGKTAIANAKMAYQVYRELYTSDRWKHLAGKGARPQRLLWASTSTKDPSYKDTMYVDELIGNETVNTVPLNTLEAFRDHGTVDDTLEQNMDDARNTLEALERAGISLHDVTDQLLDEGVELFATAFNKLIDAVDKERKALLPPLIDTMSFKLPADLESKVAETIKDWQDAARVNKLWSKDKTLWTGSDEDKWMDWLLIVDEQIKDVGRFSTFADEVKERGFKKAVVLGMGGSSLCPEVMSVTFAASKPAGYAELSILDSTNPEQILAKDKSLDLAKTLFIVSSKSGSTLEPNIFMEYFLKRVRETVGEEEAKQHFVAITDPGSKMEAFARKEGFWRIFYGVPGIGGRYSALSDFGMIPSAVAGVDVKEFLGRAKDMAEACRREQPVKDNPGVVLGIILGLAAVNGRDKLTIFTSPGISDLGAWLEQLIAESTGKEGKAIIPVDRELLASPTAYGDDRLFVYLRLESESDKVQNEAIESLESNGQAVVRIVLDDRMQVAAEFFRWEIATATAGSILGINPFNQPDVEASKVKTRALTDAYEEKGSLPDEQPIFEDDNVALYSDERNTEELKQAIAKGTLSSILAAHLNRLGKGDYFALLGYIHMNEENERLLANIRHAVRDWRKVATCLGFGPRFLHSTGQAYKGGPNSGVFLQVTCKHKDDLAVPEHKYTFGVVQDAQARGDLSVLSERERRLLRAHIKVDVTDGLKHIARALTDGLS